MIKSFLNLPKICRMAMILVMGYHASPAWADIYQYETAEGEIIMTTQPRNDLKLIGVIGGSGGSSQAKSPSQKAPKTPLSNKKVDATHAYDDLIREASQTYDIPFAFIKAVIKIESNFNPRAVSRVGAMGLMQLMPATAKHMGVENPFDPRQNILGGTRYLRRLADKYDGDINLILSGYNAGPGNVSRAGGIPFEETQRYVRNVYNWYVKYRSE